jgi:hypothetical protein
MQKSNIIDLTPYALSKILGMKTDYDIRTIQITQSPESSDNHDLYPLGEEKHSWCSKPYGQTTMKKSYEGRGQT